MKFNSYCGPGVNIVWLRRIVKSHSKLIIEERNSSSFWYYSSFWFWSYNRSFTPILIDYSPFFSFARKTESRTKCTLLLQYVKKTSSFDRSKYSSKIENSTGPLNVKACHSFFMINSLPKVVIFKRAKEYRTIQQFVLSRFCRSPLPWELTSSKIREYLKHDTVRAVFYDLRQNIYLLLLGNVIYRKYYPTVFGSSIT